MRAAPVVEPAEGARSEPRLSIRVPTAIVSASEQSRIEQLLP